MLRLLMSLLILQRVFYHKSTYASIVRRLYGERPSASFLRRRSTRDRVVAYLVGMDAWHQAFFGKHLEDERTIFLLSATAVCYDDAIDKEGYRDFETFERFLQSASAEGIDEGTAIGCARLSLVTLKGTSPALFERALDHFVAINRATRESFRQARAEPPDEQTLRRCCHDKGGRSFILFTLPGMPEASKRELDLAYRAGAACQLADDIYDRREDAKQGQRTLALARLMGDEDRRILRHVTEELPRSSGLAPRAFREAWRGYHHDALTLYDSGRLRGGWRHDLGQWVFILGLSVVPALPLKWSPPA